MNVLITGPIAIPQRFQSHPGEDRAGLRTPEAAAASFLFLLGPDSGGISVKTLEE